jgi:uncharacterized membrane protein YfcA
LLAAVAVVVGFFIGAVGIGGVLLIPALSVLGGLSIHEAAATALFTFLFTGIVGTGLFLRRGSISWRITIPVCAGAVLFAYVGAWANSRIGSTALAVFIALVIVAAGVYILLAPQSARQRLRDGAGRAERAERAELALVGAVSGFGSGLSGAGGPLFSVPIMVMLGFVPLAAIGTSQVLQIIAAVSGTIGNLQYGSVDFFTAGWITLFELAGVVVGTRAAHAVSVTVLRRMAAGLCIAVGLLMLVRSL